MDEKKIIARNSLKLSADDNWSEIDLSLCITKPGNYQATFWQQDKLWSHRFKVKNKFEISQHHIHRDLKIKDRNERLLTELNNYKSIEQFWSETIKIDNLYPLEELTFKLKSYSDEYIFHLQADSFGELSLSLTTVEYRLQKCDRYSLYFKQSGSEFRRILFSQSVNNKE